MITMPEAVNALRKGVIACLSVILCLSCSISNAESKMKLEELIQKLDAANPWTVKRVEAVLGAKLTPGYSNDVIVSYTGGSLVFEEGLIVEKMELRLRIATNGLIRLIVTLSDDASCFTLGRIKETYPDTQRNPYGISVIHNGDPLNGKFGYWTKRPWGHVSFSFKMRRPDCLAGITFIPEGEE